MSAGLLYGVPMTDAQFKAERLAAERHWQYLCRNDKPAPAPKSKLQLALEAALKQ
jgi:hypothetical protein